MHYTAAKAVSESSLGDTWAGLALLFALFVAFLAASLGYGHWLRSRLPGKTSSLENVSDSFLLASVALYASAFAFASLHWLLLAPGWVFALLFYPGLMASLPVIGGWAIAAQRRHRLALAVFGVVFFVRGLAAALPAQHGDPLLYHLLGPRLWAEHGGFLMFPPLPNALLASTWECLYLWPEIFWRSGTPLFGLVEAQLFSQWLHLFLAWGACALLVMRMFRGSVRESWLPLLGLAALFVAGVQWTAPLAKNDVGIAFWSLGAIVFFREGLGEKVRWKAAFSGILAGLALAGKITALLSLAPLLAALLFFYRKRAPLRWFVGTAEVWMAGFAAGAVPLYWRNYQLTGNPFFPLFDAIFPGPWMSASWKAHFAQVHPSSPLHSVGRVLSRFPELFRETPWIAGTLVLLICAVVWRREARKENVAIALGALGAYVIFAVTQAPEIELRYLGASLLLLAAGGLAALLAVAERLPKESYRAAAALAALVVVLATSRLPLHILRKIWSSPLGVAYVSTHSSGEAKAWIRAHPGSTVVAGDNETYYLTPVGVTVLTERAEFDSLLQLKDFHQFLTELCRRSQARYLLDARPAIGVEAMFGPSVLAPAKVFSAQGANVYDLALFHAGCPDK